MLGMKRYVAILLLFFFVLLLARGMWTALYLRGPLARSLAIELGNEDLAQAELGHSFEQWYGCNTKLLSPELQPKFVQSEWDAETKAFLVQSAEKSGWIFMQLTHSLLSTLLWPFLSQTTINGLLGRGATFVLSREQIGKLFNVGPSWRANTLIDLGAGDGSVTAVLAPAFREVFATEVSASMHWRLQQRGFRMLGLEEWAAHGCFYDVVSCLNLLDRCDRPWDLLAQARSALEPDKGRLLLAVVLPFDPYIEKGHSWQHPSQHLPVSGHVWEEQVNSLARDVFSPAGLEIEAFTRVPYLCEGDLYSTYFTLDDAVFVLRRT
uniref:Methyltransferase 9, His-X-His N1-histidine n=1 Tax=Eptatretus burgeri TaxID=7764 RepID=A0A8C4NG31_EPTBU